MRTTTTLTIELTADDAYTLQILLLGIPETAWAPTSDVGRMRRELLDLVNIQVGVQP